MWPWCVAQLDRRSGDQNTATETFLSKNGSPPEEGKGRGPSEAGVSLEATDNQCRHMVFVKVSFFFCLPRRVRRVWRGDDLAMAWGVVELQVGYFARWDSAGFVWRCFGVDSGRCPGGPPGTCARNRVNTSVACGACEPGTRGTTDGPCEVCSVSGRLVASVRVCPSLHRGLFRLLRSALRKECLAQETLWCSSPSCAARCSLSSRCWASSTSSRFHGPNRSPRLSSIGSLLNFRLEILNVGCVVPVTNLERYMLTAFGFFMVVMVMILVHSMHVPLVRVFLGTNSRTLKSKSALIGGLGSIFMGVFISVACSVFAPFDCVQHPNGLQTVRAYQQIICWNSEEHRDTVIGAAVVRSFPGAFLALCL